MACSKHSGRDPFFDDDPRSDHRDDFRRDHRSDFRHDHRSDFRRDHRSDFRRDHRSDFFEGFPFDRSDFGRFPRKNVVIIGPRRRFR